jgi:hypothetical protein
MAKKTDLKYEAASRRLEAHAPRMPTAQEDAAIRVAAKADPDAQPLTPAQLKKMVPLRTLKRK